MSTEDRRAPGATRMPFDALVEVGGALGPSFEAQAVNVSEDGMQLRTAYLPEPGQPLTCRFDGGPGHERARLGRGRLVARRRQGRRVRRPLHRHGRRERRRAQAHLRRPVAAAGRRSRQARARCASTSTGSRRRCAPRFETRTRARSPSGSDLGFLQVGPAARARGRAERRQAPGEHRPRRRVGRPDVARPAARRDAALLRAVDAPAPAMTAASTPPARRGRASEPASASAPKEPRVRLPSSPAPSDDMAAVENASLR